MAALATWLPSGARAWAPEGPVRLIVGAQAGGATDILARLIAEDARARLGQPVVVENLSGAAGNIAAAAVARARPDGRSLLLGYGALVVNHLRGEPAGAVDPLVALMPVARVATSPMVILVRADSGIASFADLTARLRREGAEAAWAPPTPGTVLHLFGDQLLAHLGVRPAMVPYRGSAAALPDFIAGRLLFMSDNVPLHLPYRDHTTRALAVAAARRSNLLPEVASLPELGVSGIDGTSWWGIFAPPGTPQDAVAAITGLAEAALSAPGKQERLAALGLEVAMADAATFHDLLSDGSARLRPAVEALRRP